MHTVSLLSTDYVFVVVCSCTGNRGKHLGLSEIRTLNPKFDRQALYPTELKGTSLQALACSSVSLSHSAFNMNVKDCTLSAWGQLSSGPFLLATKIFRNLTTVGIIVYLFQVIQTQVNTT
jgi:hypothetical protein